MAEIKYVRCPRCQRKQQQTPQGLYFCEVCRMQFDDDPDEGGSYWNDPAKRLEKQEQYQQQRRAGREDA